MFAGLQQASKSYREEAVAGLDRKTPPVNMLLATPSEHENSSGKQLHSEAPLSLGVPQLKQAL